VQPKELEKGAPLLKKYEREKKAWLLAADK